uniref:Uncharacterized protein n=1 Tax=Guillardia theta TaxID=55529 RepID=A0A7S4J9V4_GUITH
MVSALDQNGPQYLQNPIVIAADWIGFIALFGSSLAVAYKLVTFKGPDQDDVYFFGYREEKMISVFVNLFAALAYWAKLASHANGDVGPAASVTTYKYLDYLFTCPLLTIDLLWCLNLPYKFTFGAIVAVCILCAFMASVIPPPARYMWFGMGITVFSAAWFNILKLVRMRLEQFVSKEAKKVRQSLKVACMTYFFIWLGYPTLWVLGDAGVLDSVVSALLHTFLDVFSKSIYGFALLHFVMRTDKREFIFVPLKPSVEKIVVEDDESTSSGAESTRASKSKIMIGSRVKKLRSSATDELRPSATNMNPWLNGLPNGLSMGGSMGSMGGMPGMPGGMGDHGLEDVEMHNQSAQQQYLATQEEINQVNKQLQDLLMRTGGAGRSI